MQADAAREILFAEASALLGIEPSGLGGQVNLFDLGFDSLRVVMFVKKIDLRFGIKLAVSDIFQAPDIDSIANLLARKMGITP